jgi:GTP cyclohydrolase II
MRDYSVLGAMIDHLRIKRVRLMTNNPRKVAAFEAHGVEVIERIALHTNRNPHNEKYLRTKAGKLGHLFEGHQ